MANKTIDPFNKFQTFYEKAEECLDKEVLNTMCLSTVGGDGQPHSRMVLFKGLVDNKIAFFTNFDSNKGKELAENPKLSLLFHWDALKVQIRIEGIAHKAPRDFVEQYWNSRPFERQLSGAVSDQSSTIPMYDDLLKKFEAMRAKATKILCPENWGGYFVTPQYFEFWEGSPIRLHRRQVMKKVGDNWESSFLAP